ncbi:MAG: hypothetical protein J6W40_02095 [Alphaproteobacteria bacterium]|nr:hypothetical protein [Alphaproteobacteria bacterium]
MIRFYCAALIVTAIFLSYFVGGHVANIKCREHVANANVERISVDTKIVGETNDAVFRTSISGIRRVLRERYTITE